MHFERKTGMFLNLNDSFLINDATRESFSLVGRFLRRPPFAGIDPFKNG
jgi:hypothetical protein